MFFFFKQKPAYGLRISDWSSDVCSSDLVAGQGVAAGPGIDLVVAGAGIGIAGGRGEVDRLGQAVRAAGERATGSQIGAIGVDREVVAAGRGRRGAAGGRRVVGERLRAVAGRQGVARSEEHTSELQSLMRNSYAVFCLKKKTNKQN